MTAWAVASCVVLAAGTVAWPLPGSRARVRRVFGSARWPRGRPASRSASAPPPYRALAAAALAGTVALAVLFGGVVAGVIAAAYGAVALRAAAARIRVRERARLRAELLDAVGSAAADLRAGIPAGTALSAVAAVPAGTDPAGTDPIRLRVAAAVRLAEQTGAPLADVLERIEADARGTDRARAASAAQAAGATATAWLLAALPAGGIGLGYAIGTDPLGVLLHTPAGALCAFGALGLQLTGLGWARWLHRPAGSDGAS